MRLKNFVTSLQRLVGKGHGEIQPINPEFPNSKSGSESMCVRTVKDRISKHRPMFGVRRGKETRGLKPKPNGIVTKLVRIGLCYRIVLHSN